jgi:hypothetical protein
MRRRNFIIGGGLASISTLAGCAGSDSSADPESDIDSKDDSQSQSEAENEPSVEQVDYDHLHGITGATWPPDTEGYHSRRYEWTAAGYEWWYETQIPKSLSEYYDNRYNKSGDFEMYVMDAYGKSHIEELADEFQDMAKRNGLSEVEKFNLAINFVQQMRYTEDIVTSGFDQYSYYPVENLIREGGDCEDSALLLSAILTRMGYGCVLLHLPDTNPPHMAMGVKGDDSIPGTYYNYDGNRYYYIEGTSDYAVGEVPDFDGSMSANIIPVNSSYPTVVYGYSTGIQDSSIVVEADISNQGDGTAQNVEFIAVFEDGNERFYSERTATLPQMSPDETSTQRLYLEPPDDRKLRLATGVRIDGTLHDNHNSGWQYPVS